MNIKDIRVNQANKYTRAELIDYLQGDYIDIDTASALECDMPISSLGPDISPHYVLNLAIETYSEIEDQAESVLHQIGLI